MENGFCNKYHSRLCWYRFPSYYTLTLTRFNDKWSGFVENQGFKSDFYSDAIVRGGAAYLLNKDMR
jgi:hypothetical protein